MSYVNGPQSHKVIALLYHVFDYVYALQHKENIKNAATFGVI